MAGELGGIVGKNGPLVPIGDNYNPTMSVDLGGAGADPDPKLEAELRRRLGL